MLAMCFSVSGDILMKYISAIRKTSSLAESFPSLGQNLLYSYRFSGSGSSLRYWLTNSAAGTSICTTRQPRQ